MTAYIFEDHESDGLSHLFRTLYSIEVQKKAFYSCANTVGEHGRYFYLNDCNDAASLLLREKAYKYIQEYPCIPKGAVQGPDADIDKIVYDLTTLHNRLCDILKEVDKEDRVYKYIYP